MNGPGGHCVKPKDKYFTSSLFEPSKAIRLIEADNRLLAARNWEEEMGSWLQVSIMQDKYVLEICLLYGTVPLVSNSVLCNSTSGKSVDLMLSVLTTKSKQWKGNKRKTSKQTTKNLGEKEMLEVMNMFITLIVVMVSSVRTCPNPSICML